MSEAKKVNIRLLNRDWNIKCAPDEFDKLQQAALYLDDKMHKTHQQTQAVGYEQIAVMTALSLTYELLIEKNYRKKLPDLTKRMIKLRDNLAKQLDLNF